MNVYIGQPSFATKGPCDTGFHVPTGGEMSSLISIVSGNSTDYVNYLHMPLAGNRNDTGTSYNQGIRMLYWTCTPSGTDEAKLLYFYTSASLSNARRVLGCSIRPFKDIPVTPDSTWTKLKDLGGNSGIYYKSSLGLISLSSDGTNWITISDKNLGATSVYYNGNTLSESNCGKYYQWGNNYGFAWTGSVTTSNTKVNTTGYGPGNYYSGSTFILSSSSPYDWSSTQNDNLWGGTDGNIQINTELKNAYIGEAPYEGDELCFTANEANSTIKLRKIGTPTDITLETSSNGRNWSTYTFGDIITLSNVGDKVYWRNTSETDTGFSIDTSNYYQFVMTGSISADGDINFLLNKYSTDTLSGFCYNELFNSCESLTKCPKLPATTLAQACYRQMFRGCTGLTTSPELPATTLATSCYINMFMSCTNLTTLPKLPVITLPNGCYREMFKLCSKIKLSSTQTGEYQTAYRIPVSGTGTAGTNSLYLMFQSTGGTFKSTPSINATYYTSNIVV